MALSNVPGRTPLGAFYRSPLGTFTRGGAGVTYHVALIHAEWEHRRLFPYDHLISRSGYNSYTPTAHGNARWQTDVAIWDNHNSVSGYPTVPSADTYYCLYEFTNPAFPEPGWPEYYDINESFYGNCNPSSTWPYRFTEYVIGSLTGRKKTPASPGIKILSDPAYSHNTFYVWLQYLCTGLLGSECYAHFYTQGSANIYNWYHPNGPQANPSVTLTAPHPVAGHIEFHIEDSVHTMQRSDIATTLTNAENFLDSQGITWNENVYTSTVKDAADCGRWVEWFNATR